MLRVEFEPIIPVFRVVDDIKRLRERGHFIGSVGRRHLKFGVGIGVKCVFIITNTSIVRNF